MSFNNSSQAAVLSNGASEGVIKMRLDTTDLLTKMELFLKGKRLVPHVTDDGQTRLVLEDIGEPLMNEKGIQSTLMTLSQTINSQGVQGNWKSDYFEQFVAEVDKNFTCDLWVNLKNWDVELQNFNVICNSFINLLQQFASRIIENKERESYGMSMKTTESVVQNSGGRSSLFGG